MAALRPPPVILFFSCYITYYLVVSVDLLQKHGKEKRFDGYFRLVSPQAFLFLRNYGFHYFRLLISFFDARFRHLHLFNSLAHQVLTPRGGATMSPMARG